jgi:hypothetical protein
MSGRPYRERTNLPAMTAPDVLCRVRELEALNVVYSGLGYGDPVVRQPRVKANGEATIRAIWRDRERGRSVCHTSTVPVSDLIGDG